MKPYYIIALLTIPKQSKRSMQKFKLASDSGAGICLLGNVFHIIRYHRKLATDTKGAVEVVCEMNLNTRDRLTKTIIEGKDRML